MIPISEQMEENFEEHHSLPEAQISDRSHNHAAQHSHCKTIPGPTSTYSEISFHQTPYILNKMSQASR